MQAQPFSYEEDYYDNNQDDNESSKSESSNDEIDENEFVNFLKSGKKLTKMKKEQSLANEFEQEMNDELNALIKNKHTECKQPSSEIKSLEAVSNSNQPEENKEPENSEEEDTDSEKEFETGVRCTKKRQHFTNDELFYDPNMDDQDQDWINKQRKTCKKITQASSLNEASQIVNTTNNSKESKYKSANSDAVLNCPCCMSVLCMDSQRHEKFKTQFRAMFVFNTKIKQEEHLKYPKNDFLNRKSKKKQKNSESIQTEKVNSDEYDVYKPVACNICNTEVGVYDEKEEIYHFFNVLASHS